MSAAHEKCSHRRAGPAVHEPPGGKLGLDGTMIDLASIRLN
ncbi:hypothetical protein [Aestuariivirga sp.]